ncbi:MAG: hypothetical protein ACYDC6_11030 [Acidobacteriaceae bacterium]
MTMNADLTTLANVHAWLPIPVTTTSEDPLLTRLITATSMDFQRATARPDLMTSTYTETRQGDGAYRMILRHWPITAVSSLTIGGVAIPPSTNQIAPGYYFDENLDPERCFELYLAQMHFTDGAPVVVNFAAGYATVPGDIEQAVIDWIVYRYKGRPNIGASQRKSMEGRGMGDTVDVEIVDAPPSTQAVIARYKRILPALDRRGERLAAQVAKATASAARR